MPFQTQPVHSYKRLYETI